MHIYIWLQRHPLLCCSVQSLVSYVGRVCWEVQLWFPEQFWATDIPKHSRGNRIKQKILAYPSKKFVGKVLVRVQKKTKLKKRNNAVNAKAVLCSLCAHVLLADTHGTSQRAERLHSRETPFCDPCLIQQLRPSVTSQRSFFPCPASGL